MTLALRKSSPVPLRPASSSAVTQTRPRAFGLETASIIARLSPRELCDLGRCPLDPATAARAKVQRKMVAESERAGVRKIRKASNRKDDHATATVCRRECAADGTGPVLGTAPTAEGAAAAEGEEAGGL